MRRVSDSGCSMSRSGRTVRLASYGPPLTEPADETPIDDSPLMLDVFRARAKAVVEDLNARAVSARRRLINVNSVLIAPIRIGDRYAVSSLPTGTASRSASTRESSIWRRPWPTSRRLRSIVSDPRPAGVS